MAPGFCACWSSCVNTPVDPSEELDELASAQGPARGSNAGSNETPTPLEASTPPFVPPTSKDLFTKFMKILIEMTEARDQLEPRECLLKARTSETYSGKSHMDCYHFCQQYEDYFKTLDAIGINRTPFTAAFFVVPSASDRLNTSAATNVLLLSRGQSSRPSSERISRVSRPSLTVSGVSLEGTPNTSWKKPEIEYPIFNTFNLSYQSLILSGPPMN